MYMEGQIIQKLLAIKLVNTVDIVRIEVKKAQKYLNSCYKFSSVYEIF